MWGKWTGEIGVGTPDIITRPKAFKDDNGITHPSQVFQLWTADELASVGWYEVVPGTIPNGEQLVSKSYSQSNLQIIETFVTEPIPELPLSEFQQDSIKFVENQAREARDLWLDLTPGNIMRFNSEKREIDRWDVDVAPNPVNYPRARAQAARTNKVPANTVDTTMIQTVIDIWKDAHTTWEDASIEIDDIKERAIEDINAASTNTEVQTIVDAIVWPQPV